jgi:hypothetical protein
MDLEEVNKLLNLNFPLIDEYQTLGGFVLYQFQKLPVQGETMHYDNLDLTVVSAEGPRLHQIRIHRHEPTAQTRGDISVSDILPVIATTDNSLTGDASSDVHDDSSKDSD